MKNQSIAIPRLIESRYNALETLGDKLVEHGFLNLCFTTGEGIGTLFASQLAPLLGDSRLNIAGPMVIETLDAAELTQRAYTLPPCDCLISFGGGKAIDSGKYMAFLMGVPFISVPASISNDGFASSGASLIVEGSRKSVKAHMPYGVIADLTILRSAPEKFFYSGLGDVVSKITACYDWQLEAQQRNSGVVLDEFALLLAKKSVNSVVRLPFTYLTEGLFIKEVVDSLLMSGIAMEVAGSSAPASGSEHLISHAMDSLAPGKYLHGVQVGVATYLMAQVQGHRVARVKQFLSDTGFFAHVKSLNMPKMLLIEALHMAPSIKPNRKTILHFRDKGQLALECLNDDAIFSDILV